MRILPRRFWWMALLGLVTNASISLQILIKSTSVQAQVTPAYAPIVPAKWYGDPQTNTSYPDATSACKSYSFQYKSAVGTVVTRQFKEITKFSYRPSGEVAGAGCLITRSPQGDEYILPATVVCPYTGDPSNTYIYSGGTHGVCVHSSVANGKNLISPNTNNDALKGTAGKDIFILTSENEFHEINNFNPYSDEIIIYGIDHPISYAPYPYQPSETGASTYGTYILANGKTIASVPGSIEPEVKPRVTILKAYVDKPL